MGVRSTAPLPLVQKKKKKTRNAREITSTRNLKPFEKLPEQNTKYDLPLEAAQSDERSLEFPKEAKKLLFKLSS
jgi:hypothetical protein